MTLLIAYLLMWQMGIDNGIAWMLVFFIWLGHLVYHSETNRK